MRPVPRPGSGALVALLVAVSCRSRAPEPAPKPPASERARTAVHASAPPRPSTTTPKPRRSGPPCGVLAVKAGSPLPAGTPSVGAGFAGQAWLNLAPGVEVAMKHGATTREFRLVGPGRFLPCPQSEEEVVIASGTVVTTPGPGSRAGAEVMLATPFGVVLYADAALELVVKDDRMALTVKQGEATINDTGAQDPRENVPVVHVKPADHTVTQGGKVDADELAKSCDAARAQPIVQPPSDRAARGAWAANMLEWRRRVRLRCARAGAAVARLGRGDDPRLDDLVDELKSPARAPAPPESPPQTDAGK